MSRSTVCVGVVGAGAISDIYFENMIHRFDNLRGIGPSEMADTILHGTPYRPTACLACHVHEVLTAMLSGGEKGAFTDILSDSGQSDEHVRL